MNNYRIVERYKVSSGYWYIPQRSVKFLFWTYWEDLMPCMYKFEKDAQTIIDRFIETNGKEYVDTILPTPNVSNDM